MSVVSGHTGQALTTRSFSFWESIPFILHVQSAFREGQDVADAKEADERRGKITAAHGLALELPEGIPRSTEHR